MLELGLETCDATLHHGSICRRTASVLLTTWMSLVRVTSVGISVVNFIFCHRILSMAKRSSVTGCSTSPNDCKVKKINKTDYVFTWAYILSFYCSHQDLSLCLSSYWLLAKNNKVCQLGLGLVNVKYLVFVVCQIKYRLTMICKSYFI